MKLIANKKLVHKATELNALSSALAYGLSFDTLLLRHYKYWSFDHEITHFLLEDSKSLLDALKRLSIIECQKEKFSLLNNIQTITNNIYSYCRGLEYHSHKNKDYVGLYKKELKQFSNFFQKYFKQHTID